MKKEDKVNSIAHIGDVIKEYAHFYLVDVTAMNSAATNAMRAKCFKQDVKMLVVKNTLLHKVFEASEIDFKVDKAGIVHASIGKASFTPDAIIANVKEFMSTIHKLKPSTAKGTYVKSVFLSTTMSKGLRIDPKSID